MTTHRVIQLSTLLDDLQSRARVARRASLNVLRIGNTKAAAHFQARADRFERVAARASATLERAA